MMIDSSVSLFKYVFNPEQYISEAKNNAFLLPKDREDLIKYSNLITETVDAVLEEGRDIFTEVEMALLDGLISKLSKANRSAYDPTLKKYREYQEQFEKNPQVSKSSTLKGHKLKVDSLISKRTSFFNDPDILPLIDGGIQELIKPFTEVLQIERDKSFTDVDDMY